LAGHGAVSSAMRSHQRSDSADRMIARLTARLEFLFAFCAPALMLHRLPHTGHGWAPWLKPR
jgi:hypothetical protein